MSEIIAGVEVPETAAVAEATRLVQKTISPLLYHHSRRVFFFGQIHGHLLGVEPDPELAYLAAMICYAGEYAFGQSSRIGKAAARPETMVDPASSAVMTIHERISL